jgi:glycosyltransferase involved in cell wall biosynthesis
MSMPPLGLATDGSPQPDSPRPRILFVTTTLDVGGAEVMLVDLVSRLIEDGVEVGVASLAGRGVYGDALRDAGATLYAATSRLSASLLALRAVRSFAPDLVHGWMYHGNVSAWLAARILQRRPLVWTVHQSLYDLRNEKPRTRVFLRVSRHQSRTVDHITYVSDTSRQQHDAFGYASGSISVIPNGFDVPAPGLAAAWRAEQRQALGIDDTTFVVGQVARLHPMKNHVGMLDIAAHLRHLHEDFTLLLLGEGLDDSNASFVHEVERRGLRDHVRLLGRRSDTRKVMAAMDALCVPSLWGEAFPMVIGEAMSVGVVCVASDIGDSRELVREVGHLLPAGDEHAFARALAMLAARSHEARSRDGEVASAFIERTFGLPEITRRYERIYARLLPNHTLAAWN